MFLIPITRKFLKVLIFITIFNFILFTIYLFELFPLQFSFYRGLLKMVPISRICLSQAPLSSLILEVQHLNTRITTMWCQQDITVHQRLFWVIVNSPLDSVVGILILIVQMMNIVLFTAGLGWNYPCDLWSVGCILIELCSVSNSEFYLPSLYFQIKIIHGELIIIWTSRSIMFTLDQINYFGNANLC